MCWLPRALRPSLAFLFLTSTACLISEKAQANPTWLGRPFAKVALCGDPIPGKPGASFTELTHFTLRDGVIHVIAGEGSNTKGLFRWRDGVLTKLVYTDTPAGTGNNFDTVHFTTDETDGALNFVGEVRFGRPGFVLGLFEWRDGVITKIFDTATEVDGKTFLGFGYPVRVGQEVVFNSQFFEAGQMKNGIFRWDGATLHTIIQTGDDLPGSLGGFTGQPGRYQLAFDGETVGFVATDDPQGRGPTGVYRAAKDGTLTKLVDGNDPYSGGGTYAQAGISFMNVDVDGPYSFYSRMVVSAAGGNRFYDTTSLRWSNGTFPGGGNFGTDGTYEEVLIQGDLDGHAYQSAEIVDGQGDDVALLVQTTDGYRGIYAAIGSAVVPENVTISAPTFSDGQIRFEFPSTVGKSYRVEFAPGLAAGEWTSRGEQAGTGAPLAFSETAEGNAGHYRVRVLP